MLNSAVRRAQHFIEPILLKLAHQVERRFGRVAAPPEVTAKAVYAMDAGTGAPIFSKNAQFRFPPASLTKLATSILFTRASEGRWSETVEILAEDITGGSTMGLMAGDIISRRDILFGMLLPSASDAAMVAARLIGPRWLDDLNGLARELGMRRTRFLTPHGRDIGRQFSTARDLALLAAAAFSIPAIRGAAGTREHEVMIDGPHSRSATIVSTVKVLGEPGVIAGKTGSTHKARSCLALLVEKAGREVLVLTTGSDVSFDGNGVIERSDRRYDDVRQIMSML